MHVLKIYTSSSSDSQVDKVAHAIGWDVPSFMEGMLVGRCPSDSTLPTRCAVLLGLAENMDIPVEFVFIPCEEGNDGHIIKNTITELINILVNTSNNPDASRYGEIIKLLINNHE